MGILPTETVLALCASSASPHAMQRVFALKQRPAHLALPLIFHDAASAFAACAENSRLAWRLARRGWPGPLTLVLGPGSGTAVRVPDHEFTRSVLRQVHAPIHATSVNHSGQPSALKLSGVPGEILDGVDFVAQDDSAAQGIESSILRLREDESPHLLRAGAISAETLQAWLTFRIVMICTGNTCRSPMAAADLQRLLADLPEAPSSSSWEVTSCGVMALAGQPASANAIAVAHERGLDLSAHRAQELQHWHDECDLMLCMTSGHRLNVMDRLGAESGAALELLDSKGLEIVDPFGGRLEDYRHCLDQIHHALERRLPGILNRIRARVLRRR